MTDLIPLDAAIMRVWAAANTNHPDEKEFLSAVAAIREAALREAIIRLNADGRWNAIPTIEALIGEKK